ncbi:MAG TPA: CPBP family intramembrane glutamic endopeptidase, partial [Polyangiaceae bacterium]|nr:CPBP family intramembrane glutamic endopeptidase [Polyangiaceae bacterium]
MNKGLPISYPLAFGWTLGAVSCLFWLVQLGVSIRPASATDVVQLGAVEALVFVLGVFGVLAIHGRGAPLFVSLGIRPTHPALPILGLVLGLLAHFPAETIDVLVQRHLPGAADDLAAEATLLAASTPLRLVVVLFVIACLGPLVEELFFRGALFGTLRQSHGALGAATVSGLCFVLDHLNYRKWPALAVVALVMTHLRVVSGSLLPSLAMHVAFNAVTVLAFFTGQVALDHPPVVEIWPAMGGIAATLVVMFAVQFV